MAMRPRSFRPTSTKPMRQGVDGLAERDYAGRFRRLGPSWLQPVLQVLGGPYRYRTHAQP